MKATSLEYRFRFFIHGLLFAVAFAVPFAVTPTWPGTAVVPYMTKSSWLILSTSIARTQWLPFTSVSFVLLAVILVLLAVAAWLRIWGSAYVGASIVQSGSLHGETLLADGPYRHTRNPLYLGTILHTIAISMLVPPVGVLILVPLIWVFQFRLAFAEESFLAARFGQPYQAYKAAVPRFLPMPKPQVPASGARPHWLVAFAGEIYFVGAFITLAIYGYAFNPTPIRQGLLISLGVWLVALALLPRPQPSPLNSTTA
jgi:protein-S-isoprenylcysteine O-methyltransferase Ste14